MKHIGIFEIDKNMCSNCREDEDCPQKYSVNGYCLSTESDLKKEYIPETWEELVDLCKKLNSDRIYICETGQAYDVLGDPEDIEMRHQYLQIKVRKVGGKA